MSKLAEPVLGDLVAIEWTDTWSEDSWEDTDQLEMRMPHVLTVGFVVAITEQAYAVSQALGMAHMHAEKLADVYGTSRIPRAIINDIAIIKIPNRMRKTLPTFTERPVKKLAIRKPAHRPGPVVVTPEEPPK